MSDLQVHLVHSFHQLHITLYHKASPSSLIPHLNILNAPPTSYHDPLYHKISSPSLPIHFKMHLFCYYSVMVRPPFFPFSSLSVPHPISITFHLLPPLSTCLPQPLL